MGTQPDALTADEQDWPKQYFNYFTEVEEQFRRARGTGLFLLSPLDWALIETWKNSGVPLEAVLRGIELAFDAWRTKKKRTQMVNSVAYCAQAVMQEAELMAGTAEAAGSRREAAAPFSREEIRDFFTRNREVLRGKDGFEDIAAALDRMMEDLEGVCADLHETEQRLTGLEDKMIAIARARQTEEELFHVRRDLENQLRPWRGKMNAQQLAMLEKQYLDRRLLEDAGLPRLSLFYIG
jgi:hypothetical protein